MGLGLAALGRPGYINLGHAEDLAQATSPSEMEARCHAVLDEAWALGIRWFDAARSYGKAEAFLATWLRGRTPTVSSKWGYTYTADWRADAPVHEVKDHTLPTLRRQLAETRALLGDALAVYQIHSATLESGVLDDTAVLDELARLRDTGVRVGLSLSGPRQAETLARALERPVFSVVQATWNLHERSCGDALKAAHSAGWTVIVKEGLANGRLARQAPPLLVEVAARLGATVDAVALAAVLAQPFADVVLSGAATVDQVRQNAAARAIAPGAWLDELAALVEPPSQYWSTRSRLPWT
jgi:aryl-alcohol dehydrogenase-like predicted oxidoreductase